MPFPQLMGCSWCTTNVVRACGCQLSRVEQAKRMYCCGSASEFGVCLVTTHVLGLVEGEQYQQIWLRHALTEEFYERCSTSNVVAHAPQGRGTFPNVRDAMENLKALCRSSTGGCTRLGAVGTSTGGCTRLNFDLTMTSTPTSMLIFKASESSDDRPRTRRRESGGKVRRGRDHDSCYGLWSQGCYSTTLT
eukprot:3630943-Rhodomonas_salina.1